eukprot:CAMPEP_0206165024 /NCGR_PEP_ID=MMETSP1474-20131121/18829_1 /ASSEMBLY_ACC=CAM_ASM_001110 /TAXON_ID=97495 /ORGANISM="Imantonia sp., Strain RCC918" /LENGTH=53 /DNA_ID=CAMNT_0053568195 /DNA_START=133 /DNA_END=290 /DNA_ORIENTATION=-
MTTRKVDVAVRLTEAYDAEASTAAASHTSICEIGQDGLRGSQRQIRAGGFVVG